MVNQFVKCYCENVWIMSSSSEHALKKFSQIKDTYILQQVFKWLHDNHPKIYEPYILSFLGITKIEIPSFLDKYLVKESHPPFLQYYTKNNKKVINPKLFYDDKRWEIIPNTPLKTELLNFKKINK